MVGYEIKNTHTLPRVYNSDKKLLYKLKDDTENIQQQIDDLPDIVLSDWNIEDPTNMAFINNKPNVPILDESGQIPAAYLPSYVDDVIEGYYYNNKFYKESTHTTEITPQVGKIYVDLSTDIAYRWSGSTYVEISKSIVTGVKGNAETNYRIGNINITPTNIGLSNVANLDLSKAIKTITRSGTTFTYTCLDGTTGTFTQQDNNTTYSAGTGLLLTNTAFSVKLGYTTSGNNRAVQADANGNLYVTLKDDNTWTAWKGATASAAGTAGYMPAPTKAQYLLFLRGDGTWVSLNNYSLPLAANGTRGGILIGYTQSGKNYPVALSSEKAYVNVPWTDTTYVNATTSAAGLMSPEDKTKLDGLATVATSGSYNDLTNKPTIGNATLTIQKNGTNVLTFTANATSNKTANITVPTKTSEITNDSNFAVDASYVHTDNNYTTTEKNKLSGIAAGAEVNQNAFSNVKVGSTTVAADTKTDTLQLAAGSNITLTPDATNDKITIAATDTTYNFSGTSFTSGNSNTAEHNCNNITSNGVWYYTSNGPATSLGASTTDGALYSQAHSTTLVGLIAQDYRNGGLYVRGKKNGTWLDWYKIWDSRNLTNLNQLTNGPGYITGITKSMVTTALGYTPPTTDTNTWRTVLCDGTSIGNNTLNLKSGTNVSLSNSNGAVTISSTDTNTWRGILDNLTSSTNTTESLSAKLGYLLANGSARDNTKLPLAGGTMTGSITMSQPSSARNVGIIGTYDQNKAAAIWAMGASYQIPAAGNSLGSLYGAAYVYQGLAGQGTMAGGHQFVWAQNGSANAALGTNIWTSGKFIKNGGTSSQFLKADGSVDSNTYLTSHQDISGKKNVQTAVSDPSASGTSLTFIKTISQNAQGVITPAKATVSTMGAASSSAAGTAGLVPAPAKGKQGSFLKGDGTWSDIPVAVGTGSVTIISSGSEISANARYYGYVSMGTYADAKKVISISVYTTNKISTTIDGNFSGYIKTSLSHTFVDSVTIGSTTITNAFLFTFGTSNPGATTYMSVYQV